jgi:hypothetical protein
MNSFKKNSAFLLSIALATPFAFSSEFGQEKDSDKPVAMNVKEISSAHLMPPPAAVPSRVQPDYPALEKIAHDKWVDHIKYNHPLPNQQQYSGYDYNPAIMSREMRRRQAYPTLSIIPEESELSPPMSPQIMPLEPKREKGKERRSPYSN